MESLTLPILMAASQDFASTLHKIAQRHLSMLCDYIIALIITEIMIPPICICPALSCPALPCPAILSSPPLPFPLLSSRFLIFNYG